MNELVEVFNTVATADNIEALTIAMGLTGYSLRDIKGRKFLNYFKEKFCTKLPNGVQTELQSKLLSDSLIVVSEYIKENPNLQEEILEAMGDMIINGIISEDELTLLYLGKLSFLNFLQLRLLKEFENISIYIYARMGSNLHQNLNEVVNLIKEKESFSKLPKEMIAENVINLAELNLLLKEGQRTGKKTKEGDTNFSYLSDYGKELLNFIIN